MMWLMLQVIQGEIHDTTWCRRCRWRRRCSNIGDDVDSVSVVEDVCNVDEVDGNMA